MGNGWRENKGIEEKSTDFFAAYQKRETSMDRVFERTLKMTDELLTRLERSMFAGMSYKNPDQVDTKLLKSMAELGRVVNSLHQSHTRIVKAGMESAKKMSIDERIAYCIRFLSELPKSKQSTATRDLKEALGEW